MPVDDDALQAKIDALNTKLVALNKQRNDLINVQNALVSIRQTEETTVTVDPDTQVRTETKSMKDPIDRGTGATMEAARRQTVHDAQIIEADKLLA